MTDIDLDALEATARAATQKPWSIHWETDEHNAGMPERYAEYLVGPTLEGWPGIDSMIDLEVGDAQHIATFDPPTALALITRLRETEAALNDVRAEAEAWAASPAGESAPCREVGALFAHLSRHKTTKTESTDRENGSRDA